MFFLLEFKYVYILYICSIVLQLVLLLSTSKTVFSISKMVNTTEVCKYVICDEKQKREKMTSVLVLSAYCMESFFGHFKIIIVKVICFDSIIN